MTLLAGALLLAAMPANADDQKKFQIPPGSLGEAIWGPCLTQSPDKSVMGPVIPSNLTSGSGFYAYGDRSCPFFIVEVLRRGPSPQDVVFGTNAYDLPSSASQGGTLPATKEDCGRLRRDARLYYKKHGGTKFEKKAHRASVGHWNGSACSWKDTSSSSAETWRGVDDAVGDVYRVLVRVKLRSSYQETAVSFEQPPPFIP